MLKAVAVGTGREGSGQRLIDQYFNNILTPSIAILYVLTSLVQQIC